MTGLGRLNDESLWWPCELDSKGVPVGRSGYSSGDCIVVPMSSGSGEEFWMEGVVVKVSTPKKKLSYLKKIIVLHRAADFDRHVEKMRNFPR